MQLWKEWTQSQKRHTRSAQFITHYTVDALPGDLSLTNAVLQNVQAYLRRKGLDSDILRDVLNGPGLLLFQLIIVRTYLHRTAKDDDEIWRLWRTGRLQRQWLPAELAFGGMQGQTIIDVRTDGRVRRSTTSIEKIIKFDARQALPRSFRVVTINTGGGTPYTWPVAPAGVTGLAGGTVEVIIPAGQEGKRPKPRPVKRKAEAVDDALKEPDQISHPKEREEGKKEREEGKKGIKRAKAST